jgi:glyoxylase-like metal-dependent hydrolase (beta-lactamase superfamily II)
VAYYERSSRTLLLGDAVTGLDWPFIHGHLRPAAYRASLRKLRGLAQSLPIERALLAHYPAMDGPEFVELLGRAEAYLDRFDATVAAQLHGAPADLETVWRGVCAALGKQLEFRGLATVDAHLRDLVARGLAARVGPDRYARLD